MEALQTYTREQVARMWGVNVRTVSREIERGKLRAFRVGRAIRISHGALVAFMNEPEGEGVVCELPPEGKNPPK